MKKQLGSEHLTTKYHQFLFSASVWSRLPVTNLVPVVFLLLSFSVHCILPTLWVPRKHIFMGTHILTKLEIYVYTFFLYGRCLVVANWTI